MMWGPRKRRMADLDPGTDSPLNFAVSSRDQDTLDMVQAAVYHRQTLLAFQPVMRADDFGKSAFHEGLIRVLDDTGRVIPAAEFMPAIEATELGREIDVHALALCLRALHDAPGLRLSINMSARSIGYRRWMRTLEHWLHLDANIGPRLILEITESSAMMVPELVIDFMNRLQRRGICFALDDFGAGYTYAILLENAELIAE